MFGDPVSRITVISKSLGVNAWVSLLLQSVYITEVRLTAQRVNMLSSRITGKLWSFPRYLVWSTPPKRILPFLAD